MSDVAELINIQKMLGYTVLNGEILCEYKVEKCDSCERIEKFAESGNQLGNEGETIMWFCTQCR